MCVNAHTSDLLRSESCQIISNPVSSLSVHVCSVSPPLWFSDIWLVGCGLIHVVCDVYLLQADILQEKQEHVLAGCQCSVYPTPTANMFSFSPMVKWFGADLEADWLLIVCELCQWCITKPDPGSVRQPLTTSYSLVCQTISFDLVILMFVWYGLWYKNCYL